MRHMVIFVMTTMVAITMIVTADAYAVDHYDMLILHGRVVDGAGNGWYQADLGVRNGMIACIGNLSKDTAERVIDATGHVVSPGFIDIHNHSDRQAITNPLAETYIYQGVTTLCVGNCGYSEVPSEEFPRFSDYFSVIERQGISLNLIALIGHGQLREYVVGLDARLATREELDRMKQLVDQMLTDGASGMSTGLGYAPGFYSDTDELVELSEVLANHNALYASHIRGDAASWRPAIEEAIEIGNRSGAAVQISHLEAHYPNWGAQMMALRMVEEARNRGIDVTCDVPPYVRGSTHLETILPAEAQSGGPLQIVKNLSDQSLRAEYKRFVHEDKPNHTTPVPTLIADGLADNIFIDGRPLGEIARNREMDPIDTAFDLLIENGGSILVVLEHHSEADLRVIVAHHLSMIESDGRIQTFGEGIPNPRSYGSFPIVFRKYVRGETRSDAPEDQGMQILTLEEAVRKMTSFPAQKLGLKDRGLIREGMRADIVIFDPDTIADTCTYENPHQFPVGIPYVVVNGDIVVDDGNHTGVRPGMVLRSTRER
jgi:N-acyl-D-amino-acid deacylase